MKVASIQQSVDPVLQESGETLLPSWGHWSMAWQVAVAPADQLFRLHDPIALGGFRIRLRRRLSPFGFQDLRIDDTDRAVRPSWYVPYNPVDVVALVVDRRHMLAPALGGGDDALLGDPCLYIV
jgi:hypothetical protein